MKRWAAEVIASILVVAAGFFVAAGFRVGESCIADSIGTLSRESSIPACTNDRLLCRVDCFTGNAAACLGLAYAAEKTKRDDPERYFRRACLHGSANGCTNYAAHIWTQPHSDRQLACARRLFEKACAANEPFACGMVGRLLVESTTPPAYARARTYLEAACNKAGGFPCRVLAKQLESGHLGPYPPDLIPKLLARACEGGDPDACGSPATAAETFH